jgi:hypothetical protein
MYGLVTLERFFLSFFWNRSIVSERQAKSWLFSVIAWRLLIHRSFLSFFYLGCCCGVKLGRCLGT